MRKVPFRIYVAGPYTTGDVAANVARAVDAADDLLSAGLVPFLPHLTHFWHFYRARPYEEWLALDLEWLRCCDAIVRLPGDSKGADVEVAEARRLGLPVYSGVAEAIGALR